MKLISFIFALAVCGGALAQPKSAKGCSAPIYSRDFAKMEILDTTELRVRYAFCAEKIDDPLTYIDQQRLDIGKRISKYNSEFVYQSDSLRALWG